MANVNRAKFNVLPKVDAPMSLLRRYGLAPRVPPAGSDRGNRERGYYARKRGK